MKKFFVSTLLIVLSSSTVWAAKTPMHIMEKVSYQISGLATKGKIDASFITDVTHLVITSDSTTYKVIAYSPSAETEKANSIELIFDLNGKIISTDSTFVSRFPQGPVFAKTSAATYLDLGAEAIVDHLTESPDLLTVAENAQTVELQKENDGAAMLIALKSGGTYTIHMDADGKVLSQGY